MFMPNVQAAFPCRMSKHLSCHMFMPHVYAACLCRMSMPHVHAACPCRFGACTLDRIASLIILSWELFMECIVREWGTWLMQVVTVWNASLGLLPSPIL
jgi:hypothetical protein